MEAILELIKFRKDLGFEFELTCFLLFYFLVGYFVSQDCAFLDKCKQVKKDIKPSLINFLQSRMLIGL